MGRFVFAMNQSLDGYIDHTAMAPDPALFRHFIDEVAALSGSIYGRTMYEVMRYWDDDDPTWGDAERDYAQVWRAQPKWVVSQTLASVGPNATLIRDDLETAARAIKASHEGPIEVAGPTLAAGLGALGLVDEYQIYLHPVAVGQGTPYFRGPNGPFRLIETLRLSGDVLRLRYEPTSAPGD